VPDFVHLHVHTDFSLLDGAASCKQLADKARELGMKSLAITDHGNMFGVLKFRDACLYDKDHNLLPLEQQIRPIIGCEFYVSETDRFERSSMKRNTDETNEGADGRPYHLILLAETDEGYRNLMTLSSLAYIEGFYSKPRIDNELLQKYHGGLICLSACIAGEIPRFILKGRPAEAEKRALWFRDLFGPDNFFLEIQYHGIKAQSDSNAVIIEIAKKNGIGLVLTNDVHYLNKEDNIAQDILVCIGTQKKRNEEKRMKFDGSEFYFKTADEMAALFPELPEAVSNTVKIAERCNCVIPFVPTKDLVNYLPEFEVPAGYSGMDEYIRALTMDGLKKRYGEASPEILERAEFELKTIVGMGFTGYFLIVSDFINWAKEHDIPVGPGRGSGAGSIVAYALRITDIDPLKYNLLFERFLNPERISMPDFDVDFCRDRRQEVIEYVTQKYGKERVGQIITFGTLKAKNAIKDVARVLDISIDESNLISKLVPEGPKVTLKSAFEDEPKLRDLEKDNPRYAELFAIARKLEGKNRNPGLHAAGIVIGKKPLINYVPLYYDNKSGGIATQWTMDLIEACGLVKMDFLGLATLTVIKNAVDVIRKRGPDYAQFCIENIPENDPETFRLFCEGRTSSVFQFESDGMQNILKQARPGKIEDLIALNALYRPGPMDNIPQFIKSKNGEQEVAYPDPCLEDVLKETYGVIVYQEQVMQVAQRIAGYSLGEADILRRAMGKKKMDAMRQEMAKFRKGAVERGFTEKKADEIFQHLAPFAGYGFNKSHAAAYSVIAYQTAYLKANFPHEFMAATLTNVLNDPDKLAKYIDEVRDMGMSIKPPDINHSEKLFTVVDGSIVYGFLGIKGVGEGPSEAIIEGRKGGPYKDFMDFLDRVDIKAVSKKVIELLAQTGAFDCFGVSRATLFGNVEKAVDYSLKKKNEKETGQNSLFGDTNEKEYADFVFTPQPEWTREEKLQMEKDLIGFYFSGHPMDDYKERWQKLVKLNLAKPEEAVCGKTYLLLGQLRDVKKHTSKGGAAMGFAALSDYNGQIDLTFFSSVWAQCENLLENDKIVCVKGKYDDKRGKPGIIADSVYAPGDVDDAEDPLSKYENLWKQKVSVNLAEIDGISGQEECTLIGEITSIRPFQIKSGKNAGQWMAFGSLRDFNGEIDLTFFSAAWEKHQNKIEEKRIAAVKGKVDRWNGKTSFKVSGVLSLDRLERSLEVEEDGPPAVCPPEKAVGAVSGCSGGPPPAPAQEPSAESPDSFTAPVFDAPSPPPSPAAPLVGTPAFVAPEKPSEPQKKEVHIRLQKNMAGVDDGLILLRDALSKNKGMCPVFIHIPTTGEEAVMRASVELNTDAAAAAAFRDIFPVADVWCL
jgi:DNA polymerase-3 subunit alpha